MKRFTKTLAGLMLILVAFVAGAITAMSRGWGSSVVTIALVNNSGQPIQSFSLTYDTCGSNGAIIGGTLPENQSKSLYFSVCGEGGYTVEVVFLDGRSVKSSEGYVESGYLISEIVSPNGIASNQRIYKL